MRNEKNEITTTKNVVFMQRIDEAREMALREMYLKLTRTKLAEEKNVLSRIQNRTLVLVQREDKSGPIATSDEKAYGGDSSSGIISEARITLLCGAVRTSLSSSRSDAITTGPGNALDASKGRSSSANTLETEDAALMKCAATNNQV